jgi:hypothetical protein
MVTLVVGGIARLSHRRFPSPAVPESEVSGQTAKSTPAGADDAAGPSI